MAERVRARRSNRGWLLSTIFFGILAVVLFGTAAYLYSQENDTEDAAGRPPATPGGNGLVQVADALRAEGLTVDYVRGTGSTVRADGIPQPGQALTADGTVVWVFAFDSVDARATAEAAIDPATLAITSPRREPVATGPRLAIGSNIIAAVAPEVDDDRFAAVERAVAGLP